MSKNLCDTCENQQDCELKELMDGDTTDCTAYEEEAACTKCHRTKAVKHCKNCGNREPDMEKDL